VVEVEIACDESGYEGERLIGTTTDVFAHASVRLEFAAAAELMQELRNRIRSPATEYKAGHVLREKHRSVLTWLLDPSGPLHGNAHVFLVDKAYFVVSRLAELLYPGADAAALYHDGPREYGNARWQAFLGAANEVMRIKDQPGVTDTFVRIATELGLTPDRLRVRALRERLLDDPALVPPMDLLIPALVRAVIRWGTVSIVHDRQTMLSPDRVALLKTVAPADQLTGLTLVDSFHEPRVQVADVIAGAARRIADDALNGRGDPRLTALLPPYVDSASLLPEALEPQPEDA
jgi:hypothetical protein